MTISKFLDGIVSGLGERHLLEVHNKFGCKFHFLIGVDGIVQDMVVWLLGACTNVASCHGYCEQLLKVLCK